MDDDTRQDEQGADPRDDFIDGEPTHIEQGSSLLDRIRTKRAALEADVTPLDLPIPGYDGELVGRYQKLDWERVAKIARNVEKMQQKKNDRAEINGMMDTLIWANIGLFGRNNGTVIPLDPDDPSPVTFTEFDRLGRLLQKEISSSRHAVMVVFAQNGVAIAEHHNAVAAWFGEVAEDLSDEAGN